MKIEDLRSQTIESLQESFDTLSAEIYVLNTKLRMDRKLEQPHLLPRSKKDRAQILTIINEKKRG